jgi:F0F1-type ATP synthase assembly protein I
VDVSEFVQGFIIGVLLGATVGWIIYKSWQRR